MWRYSDIAIEHFLAPRNVGSLPHADVVGFAKAEGECQLALELDQRGMIRQARFRLSGANTCIASTSALTELIVGRHLEAASAISAEQLGRMLESLPEDEMQVPVLGLLALRDAYRQWKALGGEDPILCHCKNVRASVVRAAIGEHGIRSLGRISTLTRAGTGCGSCIPDLDKLLFEASHGDEVASREQRVQRIHCESASDRLRLPALLAVVDEEIRPEMRLDGGDMEIVALRGSTLTVRLVGACGHCSSSGATLQYFVQDKLRELVDPALCVESEASTSACRSGETAGMP